MRTSHSDPQPATGAAETDVVGSTVAVHPLVLISANDHLTRITVQHTPSPPRVYGAVLGSVEGRVTHLRSAFELHVSEQADELSLDTGHLLERYDMARQVFPDHDLLGWYCAGPPPGPAAVAAFHMQFRRAHDSTLVLLVDPAQLLTESAATGLPLRALEAVPSSEGSRSSSSDGPQFEERTVAVVSEEDERMAAEQLLTDAAGDYRPGVQLMQYLQSQRSAVEMLRTRLQLIQRYLRDVQTDQVPADPSILRQIRALGRNGHVVDVPDGGDLGRAVQSNTNRTLQALYLGGLTKAITALYQTVDSLRAADGHSTRSHSRLDLPGFPL